mgnify:CR=1 FL=1
MLFRSPARAAITGVTYLTAFALLSMTHVLAPGLIGGVIGAGLIAAMLAVEIVREGEVDPVETVVFAGVAGLIVAQVRWLLYFLPLEGYLAGLALVLVFYLATGVLHSYVRRQLTVVTGAEYALVVAVGFALIVAARYAGVA